MTPTQVRELLLRYAGKRVTMRSHAGNVSGLIHGVEGRHLLVKDSSTKIRGRGPAIQSSGIDKWGLPSDQEKVTVQRKPGTITLVWQNTFAGETRQYVLTIST